MFEIELKYLSTYLLRFVSYRTGSDQNKFYFTMRLVGIQLNVWERLPENLAKHMQTISMLTYIFTKLTPSLPRCHLKTTNASEKSEKPFCLLFFFFCTGMSKDFHQNEITLKVDVIGPKYIPSVHLSARKLYRLGQ